MSCFTSCPASHHSSDFPTTRQRSSPLIYHVNFFTRQQLSANISCELSQQRRANVNFVSSEELFFYIVISGYVNSVSTEESSSHVNCVFTGETLNCFITAKTKLLF